MAVLPDADTTRLASLLIATAVAFGGWLLTAAVGTVQPLLGAGIAGGLLGVTTLFRNTDHPVGTAAATLLLPVTSLAVVAAFGLPIREVVPLVLAGDPFVRPLIGLLGSTLAVGLAVFGVGGTLDAGVGERAVAKLWGTAVLALGGIGVALAGLLVVQLDALAAVSLPGVDGSIVTAFVYRPSEPPVVVVTFWLLTSLCLGTLKLLLAVAPIVELTPQTKQAAVTTWLSRAHSALSLTFGLGACLTLAAVGLTAGSTDLAGLFAPYPGVYRLFAAPGLRQLLVASTGLLALGAVGLGGLQFATGRVADTVGSLVPSLLGGATGIGLAVVASPAVPRLLERVPETPLPVDRVATALTPPGVVLTVLAVSMGVLTGVLAVLAIAGGLEYIPRRTAGSAVASAGLGTGAIAAGIYGAETLVVFALVAVSVVVWDLGERSVTTRAELGALPSVQLEGVHTVSAVGLGAVGVGLSWGLYTNALGRLAVSGGTLVGLLAAAVGVLIVVVALRG